MTSSLTCLLAAKARSSSLDHRAVLTKSRSKAEQAAFERWMSEQERQMIISSTMPQTQEGSRWP